jgi:hypothetical protein
MISFNELQIHSLLLALLGFLGLLRFEVLLLLALLLRVSGLVAYVNLFMGLSGILMSTFLISF